MKGNQMEQMKLFQWINMVSFAVNDIVLYLDTHPMDQEAIAYFNHFREVRMNALKEYVNCYGPLTIDTAKPDQKWLWAMQPMPWEGGIC
ncbi:MAG: spore coat protein CotJB [Lachnospiraceae bacterium]|nr:spore coat protein CotJB [Lachnospiraceae bacterium]